MIKVITFTLLILALANADQCSFKEDYNLDCERMLGLTAKKVTNSSGEVGIDNFIFKLEQEGIDYEEFESMAFNFFQYQYGVNFNAMPSINDTVFWKYQFGLGGLVPLILNPYGNLGYNVKLAGGDDSKKLVGAQLKLFLFDMLISPTVGGNPAALGGKWRNQLVAPGQIPDGRYNAIFYGVNVLSYYRGNNLIKKYFYACSPIPTVNHQMVENVQFDRIIYVDAEPNLRHNWGIGDATVDAHFDPAITTFPGQFQDIIIRNTWNFPAHYPLYGIHDKTCIG
jgi:hypothetical protein